MSKQQRDAIDAAMRAEPFALSQSTAEHRKSFEALMVRPYPADVTPADVTLGGVDAIELTVDGQAAEPAVLYFHGGGYVAGSARTGTHLAAELARRTGGRALSVDYRLAPEHPYPAAVEDGLHPLLIQVGSHEVLLDDAVRLAANAARDDVEVSLQVAPEGTHVFQLHFGTLDEAGEAIDEIARFFQRHLGSCPNECPSLTEYVRTGRRNMLTLIRG